MDNRARRSIVGANAYAGKEHSRYKTQQHHRGKYYVISIFQYQNDGCLKVEVLFRSETKT